MSTLKKYAGLFIATFTFPTFRYGVSILSIYLFTFALTSCGGLEKEIELEIPIYESELVVECYLEPGQPFNLLLTKSAAYFDPFPDVGPEYLESILEQNADVTIEHNGQVYELQNGLFFNSQTLKLNNYQSSAPVPNDLENDFTLNISMKDGRKITGRTRILPKVPIDSVVVEFNEEVDTLARVLTYLTDDPAQDNYYRRQLHYSTLDSIPDQDFTTNDDFVDEGKLLFGTGFEFEEQDTVFTTIFHIDREYFDFLESIFFAVDANGNPFGQPSAINSNVEGDGIGIFTGLSYDRVRVIVSK